jgi:hypothetical protein
MQMGRRCAKKLGFAERVMGEPQVLRRGAEAMGEQQPCEPMPDDAPLAVRLEMIPLGARAFLRGQYFPEPSERAR